MNENLISELHERISAIDNEQTDPNISSELKALAAKECFKQVVKHLLQNPNLPKKQEIALLKTIKPEVQSEFLFQSTLHKTLVLMPVGSKEGLKKYYKNILKEHQAFLDNHTEMVSYLKKGLTKLDEKYFIRSHQKERETIEFLTLPYADEDTTTYQSDLLGHIKFSLKICDHVRTELDRLKGEQDGTSLNVRTPSNGFEALKIQHSDPANDNDYLHANQHFSWKHLWNYRYICLKQERNEPTNSTWERVGKCAVGIPIRISNP